MAGGGALFWVIAARLATPEDVGLAGPLVAAADSLALFAQLGLNIALLKTMPTSSHKAADVATASLLVVGAGVTFALVYCLLLPVTSPRLTEVLGSPVTIAIYCVLVGATALNVLTDSVFLAINRVRDYLRLNGILLGVAKCVLPFLLAGAGAMGLYGSVGGATALCAAGQPVGDLPARARSQDVLPVARAPRRPSLRGGGLRDLRADGVSAARLPAPGDQRARLGGAERRTSSASRS